MKFRRLYEADEILELIHWHNENSPFVTIDVETTSTNPREAKLFDIQINDKEENSAVIFSGEFKDCLLDLSLANILVAHSYRYDAHVLFLHGVDLLKHTWRDTLLIGHLLDENRESYSLDSYVKEYFNDDYKEVFWARYKAYEEAEEEDQTDYACKDIVYTGELYRRFIEDAREQGIPDSLLEHVHRLQASLLSTEISGIRVDLGYLEELGVKLKRRIDELQPEMRSVVKHEVDLVELQMWQTALSGYKTDKGRANCKRPEFSFESSKQLQTLLYGTLGLPVQRNAKTRAISTDYESLQKIRDNHPIIEMICENRELQKVYSSYVEGTLDRLENGRIYPTFRVNGTVTGRISHSNPNLAQLPKSGGVRGIYIPDSGHVFISADYSQLEVAIEAHLTGDVNLRRIIFEGASKHDITAAALGCSRDLAKTINFASQYHCTYKKIAKLAGVSDEEGLKIFNKFWETYAGPKKLKQQTDREIDAGTVLTTCYGRKRRFAIRKRSEFDGDYRQGYNFKIQSPGADFMSEAFYLTSEELKRRGIGRGVLTIHDEGLIQVKESDWEAAQELLVKNMENMATKYQLTVPLKAQPSGKMLRWED